MGVVWETLSTRYTYPRFRASAGFSCVAVPGEGMRVEEGRHTGMHACTHTHTRNYQELRLHRSCKVSQTYHGFRINKSCKVSRSPDICVWFGKHVIFGMTSDFAFDKSDSSEQKSDFAFDKSVVPQ